MGRRACTVDHHRFVGVVLDALGPRRGQHDAACTAAVVAHAATPSRPVSVDKLIDLEQRAEFSSVLGQDESAIDSLIAHLRGTGGASPLPYLKLLEIHRRRDERGAYERTRTRFKHRINARAPDWDRDPEQGRALLEYDTVMSRLQIAWRTPVDAMAELETLLFRKTGDELFELPAYRDVLVLCAVARDLHKTSGATAATDVDVLLAPHGEQLDANLQARRLHAPALDGVEVHNRPTVPVDVDLNEPPSSRESTFSARTERAVGAGYTPFAAKVKLRRHCPISADTLMWR
jgi:hypothetical protein